ncbi:NADAR family protein [Paraclostridium bifermentans]|uniref:NADAR family protein n=1 Tax=Paraclostridium bifermentans TaxID=1490 RepID=UPI00374F8D6B
MGIYKFYNEYAFLDMEYPVDIAIDGIVYPNAKRAFAGMRFRDDNLRKTCLTADNKTLNHIIRNVHDGPLVRPEFACHPEAQLLKVLRLKFKHEELREKLLSTEDEDIIYINKYDFYLGKYKEQGYNRLGKGLMTVRWEIKNDI